MANDTDECQALTDDDEDIMQVEYMPNNIPSGNVVSPAQSDSSGRIEAAPDRRSSSPPMELRRSSRRSTHSHSSIQHWPGTFDDDERPRFYGPTSRKTTPEDSAEAVVHKGKTSSGFTSNNMKSLQTESEQLGTEMLLHSRSPTCAAGPRQRYVVLHSDNERHVGFFEVNGAGEHGRGRTGNFKFPSGRWSIKVGVRYIQTLSSMKCDR